MDCAYKRVTEMGFEDTVDAVERSIGENGFAVACLHDVQAALASKGFPIMPLRIYEIVDRPSAKEDRWGTADVELLLPCRIYVHCEQGSGSCVVTALKPTLMCEVFPEAGLEEAAARMEGAVEHLVDDAVGSTRPARTI